MVNSIGQSGLSRAALDAALQEMQSRKSALKSALGQTDEAQGSSKSFADTVKQGVSSVDASVKRAESVHLEVLDGSLDLHEVAALLKQSELSFNFAMKVRNKFIDAYREVMRMSV